MAKTVLGIIGGSGFYQMSGLDRVEEIVLETPFGRPSDAYYRGHLGDVEIVFLSRHGRGHRVLPSELNYRANIWGMKKLGVEQLVSVSSAGSMKEHIAPGDLLVANQFVDHTYMRQPDILRRWHRRARLAGRSGVRGSKPRPGVGGA